MLKLKFLNCCFIGALLVMSVTACNKTDFKTESKLSGNTYLRQISADIKEGRRLESVNTDSVQIISRKLYQLNQQTNDKSALVYAEIFEATYKWLSADHKKAMQEAVKALSDARQYNVKAAYPQIYALIGNLNKEITNYNMAFKAADDGLNAAVSIKDTADIIALMGLKAMFIRGFNMNHHHYTMADKSIDINLAALKMAESSPKYERLRIRFYTNICQYYKDHNDFPKAFYYGNKGVELAIKYNQQRSLTYQYAWLGESYCFQGNQVKGLEYLNRALQIARNIHAPYRVMEVNENIYDCYNNAQNYKEAMHYYNISRSMRDSLKVLDNVKQISELQVKYETAEKDKQITILNVNSRIDTLKIYAITLILLLLIIISVLYYTKERKDKELMISEKRRVDEELRNATTELFYFTESLKQKNEIIEEFRAEIEHLNTKEDSKYHSENLEKLVKEHIMTNESWESFKNLFTKVHINFFNLLRTRHANLTATDYRILSLIKLQLSNRVMANMLGVTVDGIKKSKQRLRKKMNLSEEVTIEDAIATF